MVKKVLKGKSDSERNARDRRKVTKAETYAAVQHEFLQILKRRDTGTVDLVHNRLDIPAEGRPSIGRAISQLAEQGLIIKVEFRPSERGVAHGRNVFVWKLAR
jgi:hypothetical protein